MKHAAAAGTRRPGRIATSVTLRFLAFRVRDAELQNQVGRKEGFRVVHVGRVISTLARAFSQPVYHVVRLI